MGRTIRLSVNPLLDAAGDSVAPHVGGLDASLAQGTGTGLVRSIVVVMNVAVEPTLALHAHYHFAVNETVDYGAFTTHVFGLANDGEPYSTGELDLDTLTPTFTRGRP